MKPTVSIFCDPAGTRTLDPLIKSQLLYQLSYGVITKKSVTLFSNTFQLPDLDSNQDKQNQNLLYYHYTIGQ